MKEFNYKETEVYKRGVFFKTYGEMLMNPDTTVPDLADFAFDNNSLIQIRLLPMEPEESEDE